MKPLPLRINQGYYFPMSFRIVGGVLPFFTLYFLVSSNYIMAGLALIMAFLALTTRYEMLVNFTSKKHHEYLWILGFKRGGGEVSFSDIKKIIISKRNQSKTYNSRGSTTTIRFDTFHLSLVIDGNKVGLLETEKRKKIEVLKKKIISQIGSLPIEDLT